MKRAMLCILLAAAMTAGAQATEIRVLLANHPYGEILKAAIPEFEQSTGIKVNVESLQESQLTTKLTTEFATGSSSVDVFMTRPLQEGKMFYKNGWYEPLAGYDFSDLPKNAMNVATFGNQDVPRAARHRVGGPLLPQGPVPEGGGQGADHVRRAGSGREEAQRSRERHRRIRLARQGRGGGHPDVELRLQLRRPVPRQGPGGVRLRGPPSTRCATTDGCSARTARQG